jgi:hypothetical protein
VDLRRQRGIRLSRRGGRDLFRCDLVDLPRRSRGVRLSLRGALAGKFLLLCNHLGGHHGHLAGVVHLFDRGPCLHGLLKTLEAAAVAAAQTRGVDRVKPKVL